MINRVRLTTVRGGGGGGGRSVSNEQRNPERRELRERESRGDISIGTSSSRGGEIKEIAVYRGNRANSLDESFELSSNKRVATGVKRNYSGRRGAINNECSTNDARALPEYHLTRPDDCSATQK